jgi:hypothetical protein
MVETYLATFGRGVDWEEKREVLVVWAQRALIPAPPVNPLSPKSPILQPRSAGSTFWVWQVSEPPGTDKLASLEGDNHNPV